MSTTARLTWTAIVAVALAVAGCSPITTQQPYNASDGVRAELGEQISADNLLIVTSGEGEPGVLLGGLSNRSDAAADVTLTIGTESIDVSLEPGQTTLLGAPNAPTSPTLAVRDVEIAAVPAAPGATTEVELSTPESGAVTVPVPVLDGTLSQYASLIPGSGPASATSGAQAPAPQEPEGEATPAPTEAADTTETPLPEASPQAAP